MNRKLKLFTSLISTTTILSLIFPAYATSPFSSSSVAQLTQPGLEQVFEEESLPKSVADAVLQKASEQWNLPLFQIRITDAQPQIWLNGCLGLGNPEEACTQALVSGWRVTVEGGEKSWSYRTNKTGSLVLFESSVSTTQPIKTEIPKNELPPPLPQRTVFRAIATGGIAAFRYETLLQDDGRVIQVTTDATSALSEICQISPQQLKQFQQLVESPEFISLNGLSYSETSGAADFSTTTFTSQAATTVRYSDAVIQSLLPQPLQNVILNWNQISNNCTQK